MATFETYEDDEENQGGTMQLGAPVDGQGSQGGSGGGAQGGAQKKGSGWTNLQSYITANQGKDAEMGEKVKQGAQTKIDEANTAAIKLGGSVQKNIDESKIEDQGVISNLSQDPSKVDPDAFKKQYGATWGGAESAADFGDDYSKAASSFDQVGAKAKLTDDFSGRQTLLKDAFNEPKYSAGEQRLDSFILGGGQGGKQAIEDIKSQAAGAATGWQDLLKDFNEKLGEGKRITHETAENTRKAYEQSLGIWDDKVKGAGERASSIAASNLTSFQNLEQGLASNDAKQRADAYAKIGIDAATGEYLRGLGFDATALTEYANQKTLGDILGDKDAKSYQDLLALTDLQSGYNFDKSGASGSAFDLDQKLLGAGQSAYELGTRLDAQAKAMRDQQLGDYETILSKFTPTAGLNPQANVDYLAQATGLDKNLVSRAIELGIKPESFIKKTGKDISRLDAASESEVARWNDLLGQLGLGSETKAGNKLWSADAKALQALIDNESAARSTVEAMKPGMMTPAVVDKYVPGVGKTEKVVRKIGGQASDTGKSVVADTSKQGKSIGQTSSGATKKAVGSGVKVAKNPRKEVPKQIRKGARGVERGGRQLGGAVSGAGKTIGGGVSGAAKQTGGAVSDAGKNVGGVLSGKKKLL